MLSLESEKTWNTEVNIVWAHLSSALGWGVQSQRLVSSYNQEQGVLFFLAAECFPRNYQVTTLESDLAWKMNSPGGKLKQQNFENKRRIQLTAGFAFLGGNTKLEPELNCLGQYNIFQGLCGQRMEKKKKDIKKEIMLLAANIRGEYQGKKDI